MRSSLTRSVAAWTGLLLCVAGARAVVFTLTVAVPGAVPLVGVRVNQPLAPAP